MVFIFYEEQMVVTDKTEISGQDLDFMKKMVAFDSSGRSNYFRFLTPEHVHGYPSQSLRCSNECTRAGSRP